MITVITCTGHRKEAFEICVAYVARQTYREPIQYIVVVDNEDPSYIKPLLKTLPKNITPELYQNSEIWEPGKNTYQGNMLLAIEHIAGDKILIMEDEDQYSPRYIEEMSKVLEFGEIAGEANASYYNLHIPGWRRMQNYAHASLCQTGIKASMLPAFKDAVNSGNKYFDIELWQNAHRRGVPCVMFSDVNLCIGMKGMPGRPGIGVGHTKEGFIPDNDLVILKKWLKEDASIYLPFVRKANGKKIETPRVQESSVINSKKGGSVVGSSGSDTRKRREEIKPKSETKKSVAQENPR